jgi:hypothetical protein
MKCANYHLQLDTGCPHVKPGSKTMLQRAQII